MFVFTRRLITPSRRSCKRNNSFKIILGNTKSKTVVIDKSTSTLIQLLTLILI